MKKSQILFALTILVGLLPNYIPQLNGKVYLHQAPPNNPKDWLSIINSKFNSNNQFEIPDNITTIYLKGNSHYSDGILSKIQFFSNGEKNKSVHFNTKKPSFDVHNDTLFIHVLNDIKNDLGIYIDEKINNLIIDRIHTRQLQVNTDLPIAYTVQNKSNVNILQGKAIAPLKISVKDQSTMGYESDSITCINLNIINSMVYIRPSTHIDTMHVNLIEKSNIIFQSQYKQDNYDYSQGVIVNTGSSGTSSNPPIPTNLFIKGNLTYYNKQK